MASHFKLDRRAVLRGMGISLFLVSPMDLKTKFEIPTEARADVTLRRLQKFKLKPGASFRWVFGAARGEGKVDPEGLIALSALKITSTPVTLEIHSGEGKGAAVQESDARLHADGKGWRLDKALVTDQSRPRVLLIGDSILNGSS